MNLKRSLLIILTAISLYSVFFALSQSLAETQIQSRLELYQSNLILNASQWQSSSEKQNNLTQSLIGTNPYVIIQEQYEKTLSLTESALKAESDIEEEVKTETIVVSDSPRKQLKQEIKATQALIEDLKIKLGIISAYQKNNKTAEFYWQELADNKTAQILDSIWLKDTIIDNNEQEIIENELDSWFKNVTLAKVYQKENNQLLIHIL